ncbi:putative pre-mRNA-splicing factor ATP-dependent RNA helicase PRP1 [Spatholobus suberectus]|nr:putative pre-mRNA-splicing factor ATP-dependent RNA helicase PRP1 [Spatholobus suberectus]
MVRIQVAKPAGQYPIAFSGLWRHKKLRMKLKLGSGHIDGDHLKLFNVYHAYKQNNEDVIQETFAQCIGGLLSVVIQEHS